MIRSKRFMSAGMGLIFVGLSCLGGCGARKMAEDFFKTDRTRLLSPNLMVKQPATGSPVNPIYPSIGPADVSQELVPYATMPAEGDWEYTDTDYVIGPTDLVDIRILDLFSEGMETNIRRQVSSSGFIDLPLLEDERILAEGRTAEELKEVVKRAYSPDILRDPTVSVSVVAERGRRFSILGAIARPGPYTIIRKDMRLLEAVAMAGGVTQVNIRYLYVIRPKPAIRRRVAPPGRATSIEELPELPPEAPAETKPAELATAPSPATLAMVPAVETQKVPSTMDVDAALRKLEAALPGAAPETEPTAPTPSVIPHLTETEDVPPGMPTTEEVRRVNSSKAYKWVYTDGQWVRVAQEAAVATQPSGLGAPAVRPAGEPAVKIPARVDEEDPFGWRELDKSGLARIIAINLPRLQSGDQRMNIIVRDNDIIMIPTVQVGEFYIMGQVRRPGVYSLTGRKITVKMAIAAAGNLGPLAWPENAILIRRIGNNQEQIIPLDVEAIFHGERPDIFLKPNDVIAVGTDIRSSFFAVMRNAFRLTYGFGFIWDRNFADPVFGMLNSKRFTRW